MTDPANNLGPTSTTCSAARPKPPTPTPAPPHHLRRRRPGHLHHRRPRQSPVLRVRHPRPQNHSARHARHRHRPGRLDLRHLRQGPARLATRYVGADAYTIRSPAYDDGYRPLSTPTGHPQLRPSTASLAGTTAGTTPTSPTAPPRPPPCPAVGGLPAETLTYTYNNTRLAQTPPAPAGTPTSTTPIYTFDGLVTATRPRRSRGKQVKLANTATTRPPAACQRSTSTPRPTPGTFDRPSYANDLRLRPGRQHHLHRRHTPTASADQEECFRYDYLRRLTEAWTQTAATCTTPQRTGADPYWRQWTFDTIGNRLTQTDKNPAAGDTTWTYTVGAAGAVKPHQVKTVTATGPRPAPTRTFSYDPAGNTTTRTTATGTAQTLTWDKEGHLATLTEGGTTTSYIYDADGNRLIATQPHQEDPLPARRHRTGKDRHRRPARHPLLRRHRRTRRHRPALDRRQPPRHQPPSRSTRPPWPSTAADSCPTANPAAPQPAGWKGTKGYVGGTKDDTGLTHLGAREYDPTIGRFISVDPIMDLDRSPAMERLRLRQRHRSPTATPAA